jgi:hypothetical protein
MRCVPFVIGLVERIFPKGNYIRFNWKWLKDQLPRLFTTERTKPTEKYKKISALSVVIWDFYHGDTETQSCLTDLLQFQGVLFQISVTPRSTLTEKAMSRWLIIAFAWDFSC